MNNVSKEGEDRKEKNFLIQTNYEDIKRLREKMINIKDRQRRSNIHTMGVPKAKKKNRTNSKSYTTRKFEITVSPLCLQVPQQQYREPAVLRHFI